MAMRVSIWSAAIATCALLRVSGSPAAEALQHGKHRSSQVDERLGKVVPRSAMDKVSCGTATKSKVSASLVHANSCGAGWCVGAIDLGPSERRSEHRTCEYAQQTLTKWHAAVVEMPLSTVEGASRLRCLKGAMPRHPPAPRGDANPRLSYIRLDLSTLHCRPH